nr:polysaccharide biosynthesis protein [Ipomoea batatas]
MDSTGIFSNVEGCADSEENCEFSGDESDGSEEEFCSDDLGNDDEEFYNNIDVNAESGQSSVPLRVQQGQVPVQQQGQVPVQQGQVPVQLQGHFPVQQQGQVPVQLQGQIPVQQHGQVPVQLQGQIPIQQQRQVPLQQEQVEDNQWEIPDEILDAQWHQILVQSEGIDEGKSLSTTNRIAVKSIEELGQDHHAHSQQGSTSVRANKGKQVMLPSKPRRKKLPIRKYSTRSKDFKSIFFGNDKDPINLD